MARALGEPSLAQGQNLFSKRTLSESPLQDADQRLSLPLPACTMRTIELTIIDRASLSWLRPLSSEWRTRSAALAEPPLERRLAGERSWWGARESKAALRATHGSWQMKS